MKTLKESLLADIDDTINKGEDDIYNIPSIDDFQKDPYNSRNFFVPWWIPHIMQKYRSKYPEILSYSDSLRSCSFSNSSSVIMDTTPPS